MRSTFMGLETAKRGMFTQQGALYTTGHNIANANTPGYTRQRVNFEQTEPYPKAAMNRPQIPGQVGTGVEAGSIQRVREQFLDVQYRGENNKLGYWETKMEAMKKMEEVMNEPSDSGLSKAMDMFWQSLQDLAVNPTNSGARSVVRQRGVAVSETFNYLASSLNAIRDDLKNEIDVTSKQINSLTHQINQLNKQIGEVEPHGYLPNDLYDERDRLIDELSSLVDVQVSYESSGGQSLDIAQGQANITLLGEKRQPLASLVSKAGSQEISLEFKGEDRSVSAVKIGSQTLDAENFKSVGKLKGLIETYGYTANNGSTAGSYPDMLTELDNMAYTFASEFNKVHEDGMSPNEIKNGIEKIPFFAGQFANEPSTPASGMADIVFVIDNTGSMSSIQQTLAAKMSDFVNAVKGQQDVDFRIGLVSYDDVNGYRELSFPSGQWSNDPEEVKNLIEANLVGKNAGGIENLFSALSQTMDNYSFRDGQEGTASKHLVFVTDEDADDGSDLQQVLTKLKDDGVKVHGVYAPNFYDPNEPLNVEELNQLVTETKGIKLDITDSDWGTKLSSLVGSAINSSSSNVVDSSNERKGFASSIQVSKEVMESLDNIATANVDNPSGGTLGDTTTILKLADVINMKFDYGLNSESSNFRNYYEGVIGEMAVKSQESIRLTKNSEVLRDSVEERKMSVSGISLDEEMTNMIKFQHAYNASARMITLQDEMLDKIINGMGTVGR